MARVASRGMTACRFIFINWFIVVICWFIMVFSWGFIVIISRSIFVYMCVNIRVILIDWFFNSVFNSIIILSELSKFLFYFK